MPIEQEPSDRQVDEVCMAYRHDFGLMSIKEANALRADARRWYGAWMKLLEHDRGETS